MRAISSVVHKLYMNEMSGQAPQRSGSLLVNDRRFSIDEQEAGEEINLEEINPQSQPSSSRSVIENEETTNVDADGADDAASDNGENLPYIPTPENITNDVNDEGNSTSDTPESENTNFVIADSTSDEEEAYFIEAPTPPLCGWYCCHPQCLQCCRNAKWVLIALCAASTLHGMVINGFYTIDITTIERRFGLRSSHTGLVAGAYDLASVLAIVPVSYFGGKPGSSKPKWLGCGILIMGLGSLLFTIPHFLVPEYEVNSNSSSLCYDEHEEVNEVFYEDLIYLRWFFVVGQLLHGFGTSPLYTLGVIYIDESVETSNSSVYIAGFYTMAIVGTALGYLFGGFLLSIFTNLSVDPKEFGLTPDSSAWIGAWWIGFLLSTVLCIVMAVWLLAFPPYLPETPALRKEKMKGSEWIKVKSDVEEDNDEKKAKSRSGILKSMLELCRNPTLMFINLAAASESFVSCGFVAFLPKFIENQFSINPSYGSLLLGLIAVPVGGGGTFLGGYLLRKFNLKTPGILKLCMLVTFLGLLFSSAFLFTCPNQSFAGVTSNYPDSTNLTLNQTCNENCDCSQKSFDPICGIDKIIYYSPCYAGCATELSCEKEKYFNDCKCIEGEEGICTEEDDDNEEENASRRKRKTKAIPDHEAVAGKCESDCGNFFPFTFLIILVLICTFTTAMPSLSASMRCVTEDQKPLALGFQLVCLRVLGSIPSPMVFGVIIDSTCLLWKDENGSCLVFDNAGLSLYMMLLTVAGKGLNVILYFIAWMCFKPEKSQEEDEESLLPEKSDRKSAAYGTS